MTAQLDSLLSELQQLLSELQQIQSVQSQSDEKILASWLCTNPESKTIQDQISLYILTDGGAPSKRKAMNVL